MFSFYLFSDNVPHNFELHLEIYALNKSLALSPAAKEFADRYSYFSHFGSPSLRRKVAENGTNNVRNESKRYNYCLRLS